MLGDLIYEGKGRITNSRVLNAEENKIEYTMEEEGKFNKDIDVTMTTTFWTVPAGKNIVYGESEGIITTKDGEGTTICKAYGVGRYSESGGTSFRGAIFYKSSTGKLSFLNNMIGVLEAEVDEHHHLAKIWEWK
ncbi:MAG: hypothetical protein ACPKPY_09885 [Nitrososphaeraceae archaeon]